MSAAHTLAVPGYQVVQFLGSGARSTIWQVRDRRTNQSFALKRVVRQHSDDGRFVQQAVNEYSVSLKLDHPIVRKVHAMRRVKRWWSLREIHLVMELCEGQTLQDSRPDSLPEVMRIFHEVAKALAYMNGRGYVHADMKPNNIVVGPNGVVKIIDLGQSCPVGTVKERIQGTPDFIAPEQVRRQPLDARTDAFNFGAALYWTLTGKPIPTFLPPSGKAVLLVDPAVQPAQELNPDIPPSLGKLIADCVEVQPSRRPASMNEVASRLSLIHHKLTRDDEQGGSA